MPDAPSGRLLVVDDQALSLRELQATLHAHGYDVTGATSAADALTRLRQERFDLLLVRWPLARSHDSSLLREAAGRDAQLAIVALADPADPAAADEALRAGAFDYIPQPFAASVAGAVVARALAFRRLRVEHEQLQKTLRMRTAQLEAAHADLESFSYSVTHDLRAPLRAVEGFTKFLVQRLEESHDEDVLDLCRRICSGVDRMNSLIDDLRQLSRIARAELHRQSIDLSALAREIAAALQATAPERPVEWSIPDGLQATGDLVLVRAALENLLANAWKFTGKTASPRIELGREALADGSPAFFVRDNGAGFDLRYADRLFAPFQRLHSNKDFAGNGVGLAAVHRIMQKHGGRIWAEAAPGQGATFHFTLP